MIDEKKLIAKEMFETLGWEQDENNSNVIEYCRGFRSIVFLKYDKEVVPSCHLTMDWLKAINKQCEELGWIDAQPKLSLETKTSDNYVPDTNVGKWIPCSERLPDEHENYIVTVCDECNMIWAETVVVLAEYFEGSWLWYEGGDEYDITDMVIAWMTLPEPYKVE